jgi:hypothetical protein
MLGLTGALIGGGYSIQTWLPYMCVIPKSETAQYWTQLGVVLYAVPFAFAAAVFSLRGSRALWKGLCLLSLSIAVIAVVAILYWRCVTARSLRYTLLHRFMFAYALLLYGGFVAVVRAGIVGLNSLPFHSPLQQFSRGFVAVLG